MPDGMRRIRLAQCRPAPHRPRRSRRRPRALRRPCRRAAPSGQLHLHRLDHHHFLPRVDGPPPRAALTTTTRPGHRRDEVVGAAAGSRSVPGGTSPPAPAQALLSVMHQQNRPSSCTEKRWARIGDAQAQFAGGQARAGDRMGLVRRVRCGSRRRCRAPRTSMRSPRCRKARLRRLPWPRRQPSAIAQGEVGSASPRLAPAWRFLRQQRVAVAASSRPVSTRGRRGHEFVEVAIEVAGVDGGLRPPPDAAPGVPGSRCWISGRRSRIRPAPRAGGRGRAGGPRPTRSAWRSSGRRRSSRCRLRPRRNRCARAATAAASAGARSVPEPGRKPASGSSAYSRTSIAWPRCDDLFLRQRQRLAGGDAQLPLDQVQPGDDLGDRMLHLQARVDLHEIEAAACRLRR